MRSWQQLLQSIHMLRGAEQSNPQGTEVSTKGSSVMLALLAGVAAHCRQL